MPSVTESVEAALESGSGLYKEFCNDPNEFHALTYGFTSGWMADDPALKFDADTVPSWYPQDVKDAIRAEFHYYNFGWTLGWNLSKRWVQVSGVLGAAALAYGKSKGWL